MTINDRMGEEFHTPTGPGKLGQGWGCCKDSPFFGEGGVALGTLLHGRGMFTLDVVEVDVRHVFTDGCNSPIGFNPTWGFVIGPHMDFGFWNSGSQAVMAERSA